MSEYGLFSGLYFPLFILNMKINRVNLRIQLKYREIRTRKNTVFDFFFHAVVILQSRLEEWNRSSKR